MKTAAATKTVPEVIDSLKNLGSYIRMARKRRRLSMSEVADRLNLGYQTVFRLERGDPQVSVAAYMSALWLFGLEKSVIAAAHPDADAAGKALEMARLPKRVGTKRVGGGEHDF